MTQTLKTLTLGLFMLSTTILQAQTVVIGNDWGGNFKTRAYQIKDMRRLGIRAEVRGAHCFSACAIYMDLDDMCISPTTLFGFHGPLAFGLLPMRGETFETVTKHYAWRLPPPLDKMFMEEWRYLTYNMHYMRGSEIIAMTDVEACT